MDADAGMESCLLGGEEAGRVHRGYARRAAAYLEEAPLRSASTGGRQPSAAASPLWIPLYGVSPWVRVTCIWDAQAGLSMGTDCTGSYICDARAVPYL